MVAATANFLARSVEKASHELGFGSLLSPPAATICGSKVRAGRRASTRVRIGVAPMKREFGVGTKADAWTQATATTYRDAVRMITSSPLPVEMNSVSEEAKRAPWAPQKLRTEMEVRLSWSKCWQNVPSMKRYLKCRTLGQTESDNSECPQNAAEL